MDFMPLRLNSSSLTCSICALAAIILQLVALECRKLNKVDLPIELKIGKGLLYKPVDGYAKDDVTRAGLNFMWF